MKVKLQAGMEMDVLSPAEHQAQTDRVLAELRRNRGPLVIVQTAMLQVDGAGLLGGGIDGIGAELYQCPTGRSAQIHRLALAAYGSTPAAPLAAGWITGHRNAASNLSLVYVIPTAVAGPVIPKVIDDGSDGVILRPGENLILVGAGLTANLQIAATLQIELFDEPGGAASDPVTES